MEMLLASMGCSTSYLVHRWHASEYESVLGVLGILRVLQVLQVLGALRVLKVLRVL